MNPPMVSVRDIIPKHLSISIPEQEIKHRLAMQLVDHLLDKIEFRKYNDPYTYDEVIQADLIAMDYKTFAANYGATHQRRGIADGTMAVMVNGNWKVMGIKPSPKPATPVVKKKLSASEYLTNKVNELKL